MKGLLIKDIRLLRNMKNSLVMIILVAVGVSAYVKDTSFIIAYLAFIAATFTSSTLSYDEYDNGYAFLLSLPVTRKGYVVEKYVLGFILGGIGWLTGTVVSAVAGAARHTMEPMDTFMIALALLPAAWIFQAILLPFYLKFGGEKGRIIMVVAMGGIFLVFALGAKLAEKMHVDLDGLTESLSALDMDMGMGILCSVGAGILLTLVSCSISMGIMRKKEF